jgi:hypothetical protein
LLFDDFTLLLDDFPLLSDVFALLLDDFPLLPDDFSGSSVKHFSLTDHERDQKAGG